MRNAEFSFTKVVNSKLTEPIKYKNRVFLIPNSAF